MLNCILHLYCYYEPGSLKHKTSTGLEHAEKAAIVEADKQLSLRIFFFSFFFKKLVSPISRLYVIWTVYLRVLTGLYWVI